jgi:hypothetical protein
MSDFFEQLYRFPFFSLWGRLSRGPCGFLYEIARGEYDIDLRVLAVAACI